MLMLGELHRTLFIIIIVLPFLGQGIPFPGGIPVFLPFAILLAPITALIRIAEKGIPSLLVGDSGFMTISAATLLTYFYGVAISIEFPEAVLLREIANGVVTMMVVFSIANSGWTATDRKKLVHAMAWGLLAVGIFIGILGAWKFWLFISAGELLGFVTAASGAEYPWGTSLVTDYNFYSLTILVSILAAMFLSADRHAGTQVILALIIAALIVVGFLAGSRRFWVVAPVFIALQGLWMIIRSGIRPYSTLFATLSVLLVALPMAFLIYADDSVERIMTSGWNLAYRLRTVLDVSQGFGMSSRFELWQFAIDRLEGVVPWFGSGFDYTSRFACEFSHCGNFGYPHMPILSAYLYGGWVAAIAAFSLYAYVTIAGFRLLAIKSPVAWLFFPLMAAFFFAAISANGPYSIRSHIIFGALCVGILRSVNADSNSDQRQEAIGV